MDTLYDILRDFLYDAVIERVAELLSGWLGHAWHSWANRRQRRKSRRK
jgi:hypothetical protein